MMHGQKNIKKFLWLFSSGPGHSPIGVLNQNWLCMTYDYSLNLCVFEHFHNLVLSMVYCFGVVCW